MQLRSFLLSKSVVPAKERGLQVAAFLHSFSHCSCNQSLPRVAWESSAAPVRSHGSVLRRSRGPPSAIFTPGSTKGASRKGQRSHFLFPVYARSSEGLLARVVYPSAPLPFCYGGLSTLACIFTMREKAREHGLTHSECERTAECHWLSVISLKLGMRTWHDLLQMHYVI